MSVDNGVRVLHLEDDQVEQEAVRRALASAQVSVSLTQIETLREAESALAHRSYDLLLLDYLLPDGTGLSLLERVSVPPFILVTGQGDEAIAVEAFHQGALDYLVKDHNQGYTTALSITIQRALSNIAAERELFARTEEVKSFARIASHELREPLRTLCATVDLVESRHGQDVSPELRAGLDKIRGRARRSLAVVHDLKEYAEITTEKRDLSVVDLNGVLADVTDDLEEAMASKGCSVTIGDLPGVAGDQVQLHRLFLNLLTNALKFSHKGVPPTVRVSSESHDRLAEIRVSDDGIGFDERHRERIFKVFKRLHKKDDYEGNGIGLALCRKIVERHNGTITASSPPGEGATFHVRLPLA